MTILNNPDLVGFYALGAVAIFASLRVVIHANPVHAILSMIVSLLAVAGIMFILGAPFAGALEIVVYAGAILVLFVFVIMMLNLGMANDSQEERWLDARTWAVPTGLTLIIAVVLYALIGINHDETAVIGGISVPAKMVGTALFSKYMMLVEVAALLLLAALVAAYHLGKASLNDEITSDIDRGDDNFKNSLHNTIINHGTHPVTNTVETISKPEKSDDVNPNSDVNSHNHKDPLDYVGAVGAGDPMSTQVVTRKEAD